MPFIVATYVYASSQGQRTHSARTNYNAWGNGMNDFSMEKMMMQKIQNQNGQCTQFDSQSKHYFQFGLVHHGTLDTLLVVDPCSYENFHHFAFSYSAIINDN